MPDQISVLFVCLGNICRSPMAESVFQSLAKQPPYRGLISRVDSCGTGAWASVPGLDVVCRGGYY